MQTLHINTENMLLA